MGCKYLYVLGVHIPLCLFKYQNSFNQQNTFYGTYQVPPTIKHSPSLLLTELAFSTKAQKWSPSCDQVIVIVVTKLSTSGLVWSGGSIHRTIHNTNLVKFAYFPWKCTNLSGKSWVAADSQRRRNNDNKALQEVLCLKIWFCKPECYHFVD